MGVLIANEPDRNRYKALAANVDRFGYYNILLTSYDGRRYPEIPHVTTVLFEPPVHPRHI